MPVGSARAVGVGSWFGVGAGRSVTQGLQQVRGEVLAGVGAGLVREGEKRWVWEVDADARPSATYRFAGEREARGGREDGCWRKLDAAQKKVSQPGW